MGNDHVLVSCPLIHDAIDGYTDTFEEHGITYEVPEIDQQLNETELRLIIAEYDGVIAGDDEFTAAVFEEADRLEVISKWGIGTDNIDHEAAERHGVDVYNTPGAFDDEVADVVIGYTVMLTRQLHLIDESVRCGEWYCPRGRSLTGKVFGVIGVGDIGSTVAQRAHAFGMEVLGNDVRPLPKELKSIGVEAVEKDELLNQADVVSLNCVLTEETRGLIGQEELERIGSEGYLVNTARGELVDQDALVKALRSRTIAGAALDVFEEEPLPADSPLTEIDNVVLGSHNAQNTTEAVERVNDRAVQNLINGLS